MFRFYTPYRSETLVENGLNNFAVIAGPYLQNRKQPQSCILELSFRIDALFNLLFEK